MSHDTMPATSRVIGLLFTPLLLTILASIPQAQGRFNLRTCWGTAANPSCIQQNVNGTWCFRPDQAELPDQGDVYELCDTKEGHAAADFKLVMSAHLRQGRSIAYYNGVDNKFLGGAEWPVPENPGVIRLCISGLGVDGFEISACTNAVTDNDWPVSAAAWCAIQYTPPYITDGCFASEGMVSYNVTPPLPANGGDCITDCYSNGAVPGALVSVSWAASAGLAWLAICLRLY